MERPFTALVNGVSVEAAGLAIGSDVPHTILSEAPTLVVFIDELTPMSRCVKHTLLRGRSLADTGYVCFLRGRERWRDVRTEADAAAAAAETERLLGLQEQRTSAEDPRILEAAAYMKATPALEQLTIREVARAVHLSPSRLTHLFRRDTGISPHLYRHSPQAAASLSAYGRIVNTMIVLPVCESYFSYSETVATRMSTSRPLSRRVGETVLSARCGQIQIEHPLEVWKTPPGQSDGTGLPQVESAAGVNPSVAAGPSNGDGDSLSASP